MHRNTQSHRRCVMFPISDRNSDNGIESRMVDLVGDEVEGGFCVISTAHFGYFMISTHCRIRICMIVKKLDFLEVREAGEARRYETMRGNRAQHENLEQNWFGINFIMEWNGISLWNGIRRKTYRKRNFKVGHSNGELIQILKKVLL